MKVFLTGGTGFLGGHFIREAAATGMSVRALRRKGSSPRMAQSATTDWVEGDLISNLTGELTGCDVLVHLAARGVSPQIATTEEMVLSNVTESLLLWNRALAAGVKRLVLCGSCFEYGAVAASYDRIPADAPLAPLEGYGASKAAATMVALGLCATSRCELIVLRPFHFYGEGQFEGNFWPAMKKAADAGQDFRMSPGEQVRDFSAANEVARRFVDACRRSDVNAGIPVIENIGSGLPVTMAEFARKWWSAWGATGRLEIGALPYRENEVMRFVPQVP